MAGRGGGGGPGRGSQRLVTAAGTGGRGGGGAAGECRGRREGKSRRPVSAGPGCPRHVGLRQQPLRRPGPQQPLQGEAGGGEGATVSLPRCGGRGAGGERRGLCRAAGIPGEGPRPFLPLRAEGPLPAAGGGEGPVLRGSAGLGAGRGGGAGRQRLRGLPAARLGARRLWGARRVSRGFLEALGAGVAASQVQVSLFPSLAKITQIAFRVDCFEGGGGGGEGFLIYAVTLCAYNTTTICFLPFD